MNSLRDPFSIRSKPAFDILRASPLVQNIQKAAAASLEAASTTFESIAESTPARIESLTESMAFSIPKNVPSFTDPARGRDDYVWGAATGQGNTTPRSPHARGSAAGSSGLGIGSITGAFSNKELPMYKDKPYYYSASQRKPKMWQRKRFWGLLALVVLGLYYVGVASRDEEPKQKSTKYSKGGKWFWSTGNTGKVDWLERREKVKEAFVESWDGYEKHAWGYDKWFPVSKTREQMAPQGLGWMIVDSLDTMMIMNLTDQVSRARQWISQSLTWDQDQDVNTFETTIRMLGGLLSAHYLQKEMKILAAGEDEDMYLDKATELAERLLGAFGTASGVPFASVNLKTSEGIPSHTDGGASSTAEAGTLQLEMKYLSKLLGEDIYWQKTEKVMQAIDNNGAKDGLVPIFIYAPNGHFHENNIRLGSRGDSYYEYLLKQYLLTNKQEPVYLEMYNQAMDGVRKHLIRHSSPSHLTFVAELPEGIGGRVSPKMDHLVCFLGGNLALGATEGKTVDVARKEDGGAKWSKRQEDDLTLAKELTRTCYEMYNRTATGLAPEIAYFNMEDGNNAKPDIKEDIIIKPQDAHNLQRPETVESLFLMWRITKDEIYREWGWNIFQSFIEHTAVPGGGYTSLDDVTVLPAKKRDNMESFWLAETLKYLYLLFSDDDLLPLDRVVFNTEAHPFPKFNIPRVFKDKVGWYRLPRDASGNIITAPTEVPPAAVDALKNAEKKAAAPAAAAGAV
ncbi:glycoside hydrolase family 47 protein [Peziza echinospora]|nr:glycoside hydrolase family 47 protein [Peziza echinospora]